MIFYFPSVLPDQFIILNYNQPIIFINEIIEIFIVKTRQQALGLVRISDLAIRSMQVELKSNFANFRLSCLKYFS